MTMGQGDNKEGTGSSIRYYESGQRMSEGNHKGGERDGKWVYYFKDEQRMSEGNYKDGKRDGKWVFYDILGEKIKQEIWGKGKLIKEI